MSAAGARISDWMDGGVWVLGGLLLVGAVVSLLARSRPALLKAGVGLLITTSLVSTLLAMYLLATAWVALFDAYFSLDKRHRTYVRELEAFAIRESAEGRFQRVQEVLGQVGEITPKQIENMKELSPGEQARRLSLIMEALQQPGSAAAKRRLLATTLLFRSRIQNDRAQAERVLKAAVTAEAPQTADIRQFFDWLAANGGKDGWEPLPIYNLEYQGGK